MTFFHDLVNRICEAIISALSCSLGLTIDDAASVAVDGLTAQSAGVLTGQEDNTGRNLRWLTWPSLWCRELLLCLLAHCSRDEWRPNWTWCHGIHANTPVYVLVAETTGERDDGTLCRCVVEKIWTADVGIDGGVVDDCGAFGHVWEDVFGEVEEGMDVGVEGLFPLFPGLVLVPARSLEMEIW